VAPSSVLYLINTWVVGGTETQLLHLLRRMDRARFRPIVCSLYEDSRLAAAMAPLDVEALSLGIKRVRGLDTPRRLARLAHRCRSENVAVIQGLRTDALAALLARLAGAPVVLGAQRNTRARAEDGAARAFRRAMDRLLTGVIANSEAAAVYRHALTGFPRERIHLIANGLDLDHFDRFEPLARGVLLPDLAPDQPLIAILGRLELAMKGHAVLLEALARPELSHAHLLVVGDGQDRARLEMLIDGHGLRSRVHLLGHRADAPALLPVADLVAVPSLDNESSPNVVLEAWAARRAVVASSVAGIPELVRDGSDGVLVPPGRADRLAEALRSLLDDAERRRTMGEAGRRSVEERYSADLMAARTTALYERLLRASGAPRAARAVADSS
jgi:starch synthase (maltosyl-transferring)